MKVLALWLPMSFGILTSVCAGAQEGDPTQQRDGLAVNRLELRPYGGWAFVPNSVTGALVGAESSFRFSGLFALGIDFALYSPFDRSVGAHPSYPLNEILWSGDIDASFFPWPARARSSGPAGALEPYLLMGVGQLATRPVTVVDPAHRFFASNSLFDLCAGAGVRVFAGERLAFSLEFRDLLYFEKVENSAIAPGPPIAPGQPGFASSPLDPATWYSPNTHFTNAIELHLGASFFLLGGESAGPNMEQGA
jgi:hypothetical protein